jgi:hypothetical protein
MKALPQAGSSGRLSAPPEKRFLISLLWAMMLLLSACGPAAGELPRGAPVIVVNTPQDPPDWAVKERHLFDAHTEAIKRFFDKYFDGRGWYKGYLTWGMGIGSDDMLQGCANLNLLYALGGSKEALDSYWRAYHGNIQQLRTQKVEAAPSWGVIHDGFIAADDTFHIEEMYAGFNHLPVADPYNAEYRKEALRFAGYFLNEGLPKDAEPIFDFEHHVIRSGVIGSLGAILKIEPNFWGFGWEELEKRPAFRDWTNVKGDAQANLAASTFVANAYLLSGDEKYRRWVIDYVSVWCRYAADHDGIFPANVGLSGKVGEHWDGKWWTHMHGNWGLSRTLVAGLENASLLSGGDGNYMEAIRRLAAGLMKHAVQDKGRKFAPGSFDGNQWAGRAKLDDLLTRLYLTTFRADDLALAEADMEARGVGGPPGNRDPFYTTPHYAWLSYLLGKNPEYPDRILDADIGRLQDNIKWMEEPREIAQSTCGVTAGRVFRDRDWERNTEALHWFMPVATHSLINLTCGGTGHNNGKGTRVVLAELWHFDPEANRPGLPPDIAALVDKITADGVGLRLVNLSKTAARTVVVQTGAYGENQCLQVVCGGQTTKVDRNCIVVKLEPGCGGYLQLAVKRFANPPRAGLPWQK